MGKLSNYWHTVKHLKPEQVIYRVTGKLGMDCSLGVKASTDTPGGPIALLPRLDFNPVFLDRFPAEELMLNRVSLLHESEDFDWSSPWKFDNRTPLWNYNLHYFEYLFPLLMTAIIYLVMVMFFTSLVQKLERRLRNSER